MIRVHLFFGGWLVLFSSVCLLLPENSKAQVTSAKLAYSIDNCGEFKATLRLNARPVNSCSVRLYGLLTNVYGNGRGTGKSTYLGVRRIRRSRIIQFLASRLPEVFQGQGTGVRAAPKLNLQAQVTCDDVVVESTVAARYLDCGDTSKPRVSSAQFLKSLQQALR